MKYLIFSLLLIPSVIHSQTKTIFFKRHYIGFESRINYSKSFYESNSNFGMAPERWVKNSELKKVKFINDSTAVMITSEVCEEKYSQRSEKWTAGADTVINHPLFSAPVSIDSMRKVLKKDYYFQNNMKEVEFEGFENNENKFRGTEVENKKSPKNKRKITLFTNPSDSTKNKANDHSGYKNWFLFLLSTSFIAGAFRPK